MTSYRSGRRRVLLGAAIVVALLLAAAIGAFAYRTLRPSAHDAAGTTTVPTGSTGSGTPTTSATTLPPPPPLVVRAVDPDPGAHALGLRAPITISFSSPLAKDTALPSLSPATAGIWSRSGAEVVFRPATGYVPLSVISVRLPGGPAGIEAADGSRLEQTAVEHFRVTNGSVLHIQELLSELAYSPLAWTSKGPTAAGTFRWREPGWPARLRAMWRPGIYNVFTKGLVMSFEADHSLTPNGRIDAALWEAFAHAQRFREVNTGGYNYALVDKADPESFTLYHDGRVVLRSGANTGIAGSPTPDGTFPVFTRLRSQVMRGTNPGGSSYADLVQYIAYFHDNDAVHYMPRADYGIPQSLGCVELPFADAARAWPYLAYGTLVTIIN